MFPNSLNLYIFGLQAMEILNRFILYFVLVNFLCNHFVTVNEPKINLNFHKYNTVTRIDSSSNIITFYAYYFGNYITLRKDFKHKNRVVLLTKIDLNLHLAKRTSRAANLFNVSETETYWINLVAIGLLISKVSLKLNINFFIYIFFIQLFLSLLRIYLSEIRFSHHNKIKLATTKDFFLIESSKICDDLNNENQYLCLQLYFLNQIKCHKNYFLYLKLILLLSGDMSLNPGSIQNNHLKENWKKFRNRGLQFIHLNINSLQPKIDELREIIKISSPTVIGITETKLDNSIDDSEISIDGYCAIRRDRNRKGGGVICYFTNKICCNTKNCISNEVENIFDELLIPKTKPITVGIVYKPPDQTRFLEILSNILNLLNMLSEEWHILGDLNIKSYHNGSTLGEENKNIIKYHLKQKNI